VEKEKDPYHWTNIFGLDEKLFGSYPHPRRKEEEDKKMEIYKVIKIVRINDWLDIEDDGYSTCLSFKGHSMEEAQDLYNSYVHQSERSEREGVNYFGMKAEFKSDGLCYLENGKIIDPDQPIDSLSL
jgi:hypothetical protein